MTEAPRPHPPIASLLAIAAAQITVADAELRVLQDQQEAVEALGVDLDDIARQATQDATDATADRALWRCLQERRAAVTDDTAMDELHAMVAEGAALVERFEARAERRARHEEALELVAQARVQALDET